MLSHFYTSKHASARIPINNGYSCEIHSDQEILLNQAHVMEMDLIIPCWTMGEIDPMKKCCRTPKSKLF